MSESQLVRAALAWGVGICLLAVAIGAFGAHMLKDLLLENQRIDTFRLANQYQFYHGLALIVIGAISSRMTVVRLRLVLLLMLLGTCVFSGSLYLLSITNVGLFGALTPIGGASLIIAWLLMLDSTLRTHA